MVEPTLVGVLKVLWPKPGGDNREGVRLQSNRQSDVGHQRCLNQADSSPFIFIAHHPQHVVSLCAPEAGGGESGLDSGLHTGRRSLNESWMAADPTKRLRTNGALDAINSQRKAPAELVAQRQREADVLTGLKTEQAAAAPGLMRSRSRRRRSCMWQFLGGTTEQAIRWLIWPWFCAATRSPLR
jgi:hypothetical protein